MACDVLAQAVGCASSHAPRSSIQSWLPSANRTSTNISMSILCDVTSVHKKGSTVSVQAGAYTGTKGVHLWRSMIKSHVAFPDSTASRAAWLSPKRMLVLRRTWCKINLFNVFCEAWRERELGFCCCAQWSQALFSKICQYFSSTLLECARVSHKLGRVLTRECVAE